MILGAGAMACLFAARLSAAGIPVTLLGNWPAGLAALQAHGVRLVEPDGAEAAHPVTATSDPADCAGAQLALVLVKAWQTGRAAQQLGACLAPDGLAVTLQNGLGNRETLAGVLSAGRVALGVTTAGATLLEPGRVRAAGAGKVTLGPHPHIAALAGLLRRAGFNIESAADPTELLWGKLVINAAINPLTALLRAPNGALLERPLARAIMAATASEAAAVAAAQGIALPYPDPVAAVKATARQTAANYSSMFQDIQRRARTEIDAINGAIVRAGEATQVAAPINRTLWQLVKAIEETFK